MHGAAAKLRSVFILQFILQRYTLLKQEYMQERQLEMTTEKLELLNSARAEKMRGMSPRERGDYKVQRVIEWTYKWGYVSAKTAELVCNTSRTSIAKRLEKAGLLISTKTKAGGALRDVPSYIFTLSRLGLELAEKNVEELIDYELDPFRIRQDQLRHSEIAQIITATQINQNFLQDFFTEKEAAQKSEKSKKQPDIIWHSSDQTYFVEIELSAKWGRKLDQFVEYNVLAIAESRCDKVLIYSDSDAIIKRYSDAFTPGRELNLWEKNKKGFYDLKNRITVPEYMKGQVLCLKI